MLGGKGAQVEVEGWRDTDGWWMGMGRVQDGGGDGTLALRHGVLLHARSVPGDAQHLQSPARPPWGWPEWRQHLEHTACGRSCPG